MYLAIDIGGSKTLLAIFNTSGEIIFEHKFPTSPDYQQFLADFGQALKSQPQDYQLTYCCCAVPGLIDQTHGVGLHMGNLPWENVPIKADISRLLGGMPVVLENDAKLAGLSEALLVKDKYQKVFYLTIGTGIGGGVIIGGKIDADLADSEPGQMVLEHEGQLKKWEDFASGQSLIQRFGKRASELTDPAAWAAFSKDVALGLDQVIAVIKPEVVIIGGGVGAHFDKFGGQLKAELKKLETPMVPTPPVMQAKRPEEAVIYGCYELIKQQV